MLTIAHRGASASAPENTLAAFREAIRERADLVEMDLRLSRGGEVVVFHDRELDRTTGGSGPVGERTLEELKRLDAGSWFSPEFRGERIPSLKEALDLAAAARIGLCLELKIDRGEEEFSGRLVSRVLDLLSDNRVPGRIFLASFDLPTVQMVLREGSPGISTGLIFRDPETWGWLVGEDLTGINLLSARWDIISAERVEAGHRAGKEVWAWTVDDRERLELVRAAGVDGVASNDPVWLKRELARMDKDQGRITTG